MKKYFISNNSINDNSINYFNLLLNFLLGFIIVFYIIYFTFGRNIKISFDYFICITFILIIIILYKIIYYL